MLVARRVAAPCPGIGQCVSRVVELTPQNQVLDRARFSCRSPLRLSRCRCLKVTRKPRLKTSKRPLGIRFSVAADRDYAAFGLGRYAAGCAGQRAGICRGVMCGSEAFPGTDIGAIGGSGCALGRSRAGRSSLLNSVFAAQL